MKPSQAQALTRLSQWRGATEQELQELIKQASKVRIAITTAKTVTKKQYYEKKFAKISVQVRQMVAALQRMQSTEDTTGGTLNLAPNEQTDSITL